MNNNSRIHKLQEKFDTLTIKSDFDKGHRLEHCETRYRHLERGISDFTEYNNKRWTLLQEQLHKLINSHDEEFNIFGNGMESRLQLLKKTYQQIEEGLLQEQKKKVEVDQSILQDLEVRRMHLSESIEAHNRHRVETTREAEESIKVRSIDRTRETQE